MASKLTEFFTVMSMNTPNPKRDSLIHYAHDCSIVYTECFTTFLA